MENASPPVDLFHSFSVADVSRYGSIEKAIIMKEIISMAKYKLRNGKDGWVYYSVNALALKFCYMAPRSIGRWMKDLEADGHLETRIHNKLGYDQTKSYFPTCLAIGQNGQSNDAKCVTGDCQNGEPTKMADSISQNGQWNGQNGKTIPPRATPQSASFNKVSAGRDSVSWADEILGHYRRRENMEAAKLILVEHIEEGDPPEQILAGTKAMGAAYSALPSGWLNIHIPSATTFFRNKRWKDDPGTVRNKGPNGNDPNRKLTVKEKDIIKTGYDTVINLPRL